VFVFAFFFCILPPKQTPLSGFEAAVFSKTGSLGLAKKEPDRRLASPKRKFLHIRADTVKAISRLLLLYEPIWFFLFYFNGIASFRLHWLFWFGFNQSIFGAF
jgi:hypothetical protein